MHPFHQPPALLGEKLSLIPLEETDFEQLFTLAADPLVWEQHPNPNRYKREVFSQFFAGAMESGAAYKIMSNVGDETIGCSRFYDHRPETSRVNIGYTFFGRAYWGKGFNPMAKEMMLNYAFQFVETVEFHVGACNKRSQIAMESLGAIKVAERPVTYHGEQESLNFIYELHRVHAV